ncbi:phage late control D family protein [Paenibacillus lignilyticus]|uniref:Phage late control D family protein n=1 Tax=Paenibacillus lignilyticus TaxID=1172615 RepID=A0ABS5C6L7_9BACL|nr:contractile injection system protein, VgrG/Pvc8 family [Paenibacillus lignilyticus]MBP3961287.1 phage late control D family protein [Paenibacillus lignilyticus]
MADVKFDNSTYQFDSLEQKYRNFFAPAFEIVIDGNSMIRQSVAISSVKVNTTVNQKADSFHFTVQNAFDPVRREFQWINSFLAVGKYVEIKMGYTDKLETVFYGIITSVDLEYPSDGNPTVSVSGMDISFLMMKGSHSNSWKEKKDSDVVKVIGAKYGAKLSVDTTTVMRPIIEQIRMTDYQFLKQLAKSNDYDFFVVGKTLYFRESKNSKTPVITLMYGKNLRSYSTSVDITNQVSQVIVRGFDPKTSTAIEATSGQVDIIGSNSRTGKDIMRSLADYTKEYVYTNATTMQEAQDLADAMMNERAMDLVTGSGESIGIPEIRAGRYIKLDGLGAKFNQPMYLTEVSHSISASGYTTSFEVGGNAI